MKPKICVECRHCSEAYQGFEWVCLRNATTVETTSVVIGETRRSILGEKSCVKERYEKGGCGLEGKYFEPRKPWWRFYTSR